MNPDQHLTSKAATEILEKKMEATGAASLVLPAHSHKKGQERGGPGSREHKSCDGFVCLVAFAFRQPCHYSVPLVRPSSTPGYGRQVLIFPEHAFLGARKTVFVLL